MDGLIDFIATMGAPIASGYARRVNYSPRHNVIIKRTRGNSTDNQTKREIELWRKMTPEERIVFPVVDVVEYKGISHIIMKRCRVVADLYSGRGDDTAYYERSLEDIVEDFGLDKEALPTLEAVVDKYDLRDLHGGNLGVDDHNRLVVLDAGYHSDQYNGASSYSYTYGEEQNSSRYCECTDCRRRRGEVVGTDMPSIQ